MPRPSSCGVLVVLACAISASCATMSSNRSLPPTPEMSHVGRMGPARLYPDPGLTPGKADTLSVAALTATYMDCPNRRRTCTYSRSHRDVPETVHTQVYDEYSVPQAARNFQSGEVDHLVPMCAGGSNDISNLWYQPAHNQWNGREFGFHERIALRAGYVAE